ncbi:hypothetical protein KAOT1_11822 [Kordia algicida OT-1]|uniref:Uncharacterized protein n=1 Tax=Kordia algicida OT-1 TaxID=391587 RepID=A9DIH1_9FLAO|nr:hypothetical protein KAOT1_11822 [Kordia algicida OT-1]
MASISVFTCIFLILTNTSFMYKLSDILQNEYVIEYSLKGKDYSESKIYDALRDLNKCLYVKRTR